MASIAVRLSIQGRVQGVGFRAWAAHQAQRRGLTGWVRNCRDGSVEALIVGEAVDVESMIDACRLGPPLAQVSAVLREPWRDDGATGFDQRPTA
jgi:acylphosphatase